MCARVRKASSSVCGENAALSSFGKNERNAFWFFLSRSLDQRDPKILFYSIFIYLKTGKSDGKSPDATADVVLARRRRRRRGIRSARDRRTVFSSSKRRRRGRRGEGDVFASVAAREEVPGCLGGGVEVSEHDGY